MMVLFVCIELQNAAPIVMLVKNSAFLINILSICFYIMFMSMIYLFIFVCDIIVLLICEWPINFRAFWIIEGILKVQ